MAIRSQPMTAAEVREAERLTMLHVSESALMDAAAAAVAHECGDASPVAILVGSGNNGGDALLAGALLAKRGTHVTAILFTPDAHPRGLSHLAGAGGRVVEWGDGGAAALAAAALVVDGIVGLGGRGGLRDEAIDAVTAIPPEATVVAVDLPSGLDPDSPDAGVAHVKADVTVTFTAPKVCLVREPAAASAGRVVIADVGVAL
jgi:hydroxyethylthiazole kinase-like uncharacterized protein yjeF